MRRFWIALAVCLALLLPALAEEGPTLLGVSVAPDASSADLTSLAKVTKAQASQLAGELALLPAIAEVDLRGVQVDRDGQAALLEACPGVHFLWEVSVGTARVDGDASWLNLDELIKSSTELNEIRKGVACLPKLQRVTMYKFRYSLDAMMTFVDSYPDVTFEWTMHWPVCKYVNSSSWKYVDLRTDATAFSTLKGRQEPRYTADQLMRYLRFTPDLLALDVGHNNVSDLSFLSNWPGLRRLICIDSQSPVTDISPLAELKDLEYIELFMQEISDLTPLANHDKLLDLNLCHNNITDFSPLYTCTNLERLYISYNPGLTPEAIAALQEALPNCRIETETWGSTDAGWRKHPRYDVMYKSFEDNVYYPFDDTETP